MKSKKSKLLSLVLAIAMISTSSAYAANLDNKQETLAGDGAVSTYAAALRAYVDNKLDSNTMAISTTGKIALDKIVESFIAQHGKDYDIDLLSKSTRKETIIVNDESKIVVNGAVVTVLGNNTVEATPDRIAKGAIPINSLLRASGTTPILSYYYACYGAVAGQELWRVTQEAQFIYTGNSVTVNYSNGFYTHGTLSIWQTSNWENSKVSSILVDNVWTKRVMSSGNFHFGLEYEGIGLVVQDFYVTIDARCTVNGETHGYYTVN